MDALTVSAESGSTEVLGKAVSDLQSRVRVNATNVTGTLKYVTGYTGFSDDPTLQEGNYLAVKVSDIDTGATSVKIGLRPTWKNGELKDTDEGLVELINDPDKNGVFYIKDNTVQKLVVVQSDGTKSLRQEWTLSDLTVQSE